MAEEKITDLWQDYQDGLEYQAQSGLAKKLPLFVKFYEGEQWPKATKNTQNLPRPVINIIKMICRNKKSAILSVPVKIIYRAETDTPGVEVFNRFSEYIQKEMGQEALDKKAIDDGVKKGSYFYHYFWDADAKGKDGSVEGGVRCEIIDPLNIFFSDPTETDEQKQEWILIASRENIKSVRAKCDRGVDVDSITADENDSKYETVEQKSGKLVTVLTRYFRKNGEVYCERATKSVVIKKPFALTPNPEAAAKTLGLDQEDTKEDAPNNSLPDDIGDKNLFPDTAKATLFPIVVGNYEIKERSIYGLGEVEGLIPNQKAINFNMAMLLLNAQQLAWGKYIVLPNALKGQVINNEPGQVLIDNTNTGNGIRKMTEQSMQSQPLQLIETLTSLTRTVTGATEVMTGETLGAGMSGAAIAQLQAQASGPVEELKDAFWLTKEKQGRVLAQFFKLFYMEKEFSYQKEEEAPGETRAEPEIFHGNDYKDIEFSVVVEATSGTKASAAGDINALDVLLSKGAISLSSYLRAYPKEALSNRTELMKAVEEEEQSSIRALTAQLNEAQTTIDALQQQIAQQQGTVNKVLSIAEENRRLRVAYAELYTEAKAKIQAGNEQINRGNAALAQTEQDAGVMAQALYNGAKTGQAPVIQG